MPSRIKSFEHSAPPHSETEVENLIHVTLSPVARHAFWWYILVYQLMNGVVLGALGAAYATVRVRDSILWYLRYTFLFSREQMFLEQVHVYVSAGYMLLAGFYLTGAITMIWHSVCQRRLCYGISPPSPSTSWYEKCLLRVPKMLHWVVCNIRKLIQIHQYLGIRGPLFSAGFFIKEAVESALQTTQAYKSSQQLSNVAVNLSYAMLIFLNCFACGMIDFVFRCHPTTQRLVSVLVDLVLDFAWGTVIPCIIMWPYVQMYLSRNNGGYIEGDLVQQELQYLLVMSTSSFVLSVFPFVSSLGNIRGMKRLLSVGMLPNTFGSTNDESNNLEETRGCSFRTRSPATLWPAKVSPSLQVLQVSARRCICSVHRWTQIGEALLLVYGVGVLGVAINGASRSGNLPLVGCTNRVYPWLSADIVCSKVTVNCTQIDITGRRHEMEAILGQLDKSMLASLEIVSCSTLEMPPGIRKLSKLTVLTIRNSTLHSWRRDAALTGDALPNMLTLRLESVHFARVPEGLIDLPLPPWLEWISIYDVNADVFIERVGANWSKLKYFYCDLCGLSNVPQVVGTMTGLLELSLCYNNITDLGGDWLATAGGNLENLWVDACMISSFPADVWQLTKHLHEFSIQRTNISLIPTFVDEIANGMLQLDCYGTPLCDSPEVASAVEFVNCDENVY